MILPKDDDAPPRVLAIGAAGGDMVGHGGGPARGHPPSGAYWAIVDSTGQLHLALDDMRTLEAITPDVLQANTHRFNGAAMVFLDANLAPETIAAAVRLAQQAGVPIRADPVSRTR